MFTVVGRVLTTVAAPVVLAVVLAGCGGGGDAAPRRVVDPVPALVPPAHGLAPGTITVAAGTSEERGNVVVGCPAGPAACVLTVLADGTAVYDPRGGRPAVEAAYDLWRLPAGHGLNPGEIVVAAGQTEEHGNVAVTCPPGGRTCVVRVAADGAVEYARTGGVPTVMFALPGFRRDNPAAEDLLDHWNDPERLRQALGLAALNAADEAHQAAVLSVLIHAAGGDPAGTGARLRNLRPEDVEIIGERDGITHGQWKGGPAGKFNIEFDWRFAPNFAAETRARMERAGKSWSWRIEDDFEPRVVERGEEIPYPNEDDVDQTATLARDVPADDVLIFVFDKGQSGSSAAGPRYALRSEDDYQPFLGVVSLSQRHVESTAFMAHEIGHVIGLSDWEVGPLTRYINRADHTFEGPEAMRANGGAPVPFQWVDAGNRPVAPNTRGARVDWGHFAVCTSIMAYCSVPAGVYRPAELDFAYLADVGYEIGPAGTENEPEVYGYGAWGRYSAWGAGVERTIDYQGGEIVNVTDTLRAGADAFGTGPGPSLAETHGMPQGAATWSGSLIGVDLGQPMLPPVFGDAELQVELSTLDGVALFDQLTVHVGGVSRAFRAPQLRYDIGVTGNNFSDRDGHVLGGFFGPAHEEMAGVLDDRRETANLIAGFGGKR